MTEEQINRANSVQLCRQRMDGRFDSGEDVAATHSGGRSTAVRANLDSRCDHFAPRIPVYSLLFPFTIS